MQLNKTLPAIEVISSKKLNEIQREKIKNSALRVFGLTGANFDFTIDDSLIGGFSLKFGSLVLDMSVRGRLQSL